MTTFNQQYSMQAAVAGRAQFGFFAGANSIRDTGGFVSANNNDASLNPHLAAKDGFDLTPGANGPS